MHALHSRPLAGLLGILLTFAAAHAQADDWGAFRGPTRDGVATAKRVPTTWGPEQNIRWKVALPGPGNSSPVVVGSKVFLTCATDEGRRRGTYAYDRATGRLLWERIVEFPDKELTHNTNPYCGSSPAADEARVVVWHGSAGLHSYDHAGKSLWSRDLGRFTHIWGYGSSPVLDAGRVYLNAGPGPRQFVACFDAATGATLWQTDIPGGSSGEPPKPGERAAWTGSWATPLLHRGAGGRLQVIVPLPGRVAAFDAETGREAWSCAGLGDLCYTDVALGQTQGIAMSGYHGPAIGFRLGGQGDVTATHRLWQSSGRNPQRIGTGILWQDKYLIMANEDASVQCLEVATGNELWRERLPQGGRIWTSLVLAEGRFYVTTQNGLTYVFRAGPEGLEVLAENDLKEGTNSTLAVVDGEIYLRTFEHLYAIGTGQ